MDTAVAQPAGIKPGGVRGSVPRTRSEPAPVRDRPSHAPARGARLPQGDRGGAGGDREGVGEGGLA